MEQAGWAQAAREEGDADDAAAAPTKRKRADSPVGRLLDQLAVQNAGTERFSDAWLETLKEIVDSGQAAVPELIEELDATDDDMMLRCLGFTLRAIGDPRAVPALIRAVPKTLRPPGSDMGLRSHEEELEKFAQKHDLDRRHQLGGYSFGRPVREIFAAIESLTDHKIDEQQLYSIFREGMPGQLRMKGALYAREARKWADWWEKHATKFVQDKAYLTVGLEKSASASFVQPPDAIHYKTVSKTSNWVLQSIFDPKQNYAFYDLDTGRAAGLPDKWREAKDIESQLDEILAWAVREGFDLMGTEMVGRDGERYYVLRSIGLFAWELGPKRWKLDTGDITLEALQNKGTPAGSLLLHFDQQAESFDPKATATFFYITREATPGLLFVGIEVKDDSLKPGGIAQGDNELNPVAFHKGRRFAYSEFEVPK